MVERAAAVKLAVLDSGLARSTGRLDPKHLFAARDLAATPVLLTGALRRLRDLGELTQPSRFKRVYATAEEERVPYLRPYDIFDYLPGPADWLSKSRSGNLQDLLVEDGTLLQTCSGRNLGPAVLADRYLVDFAFSHDLIRIKIEDETERLTALAYLRTVQGRRAIARDRAGSVIDHLTPGQVGDVGIPEFQAQVATSVAYNVKRAGRLRSLARRRLRALHAKAETLVPLPPEPILHAGYTVPSTILTGRVDAAFYSPFVLEVRERLRAAGAPVMGDLARVEKPGGRYSPRYVAPEYGEPLLSGRQILQWFPIALKHVATISFKDVAPYRLAPGTIVYQADGRAEEGLGNPSVVTSARNDWLASGHVGRLVGRDGTRWGALYLGLATRHGQAQIRASASGSVVDSTFEADMASIMIPPVTLAMASAAERAWNAIAAADELERSATADLQASLEAEAAA